MKMHPQLPLDVVSALIKHLVDTGVMDASAFLERIGLQRAAASMTGRTELAESHRAYEEFLRATILKTDMP